MHHRWQVEAGGLQDAGPEQGMEISDVLADEVMDFHVVILPPIRELLTVQVTPLLCAGNVANGRIEPDIPVVAGKVRDLEAEVLGGASDIPVSEFLAGIVCIPLDPQEVPLQIVGDLGLQMAAGLCPLLEKLVQLLETDEPVWGLLQLGNPIGQRAARVDQLVRCVVGQALVAMIAVLVLGLADRTCPAHKSIGQKCLRDRVIELFNRLLHDQPGLGDLPPDLLAELPVFRTVGRPVVVERQIEAVEVTYVRFLHPGDDLLLGLPFLPCPNHDRRAVSVVGPHPDAAVSAEALEPDPDVRLDELHQMSDVNVTVGIGQCSGHQNASTHTGFLSRRRVAGPAISGHPGGHCRGQSLPSTGSEVRRLSDQSGRGDRGVERGRACFEGTQFRNPSERSRISSALGG